MVVLLSLYQNGQDMSCVIPHLYPLNCGNMFTYMRHYWQIRVENRMTVFTEEDFANLYHIFTTKCKQIPSTYGGLPIDIFNYIYKTYLPTLTSAFKNRLFKNTNTQI